MDKKYKSVLLDEETHRRLKEYCNMNGYSMSGLIRKWVNKHYRTSDGSIPDIEPPMVLKVNYNPKQTK